MRYIPLMVNGIRFSLHITKDFNRVLEERADKDHRTRHGFVLHVLQKYLEGDLVEKTDDSDYKRFVHALTIIPEEDANRIKSFLGI